MQIYDLWFKGELITFSKLVKVLDGRLTRNAISTALDSLDDTGIIKWKYKTVFRRKVFRKKSRAVTVKAIELTKTGENFAEIIYNKVIKEQ